MSDTLPEFVRLEGAVVTLVLGFADGVPAIVYWGPKLAAPVETLAALGARGAAPSSPAREAPVALTPMAAFPGRPGLAAHRDGAGALDARVVSVVVQESRIAIVSRDAGIALHHDLALVEDVLVASTTLVNDGPGLLDVSALAAPVVPLPDFVTRLTGFEGRWAGEFARRTVDRLPGQWVRENRRGRTSHDSFPGLIATDRGAGERVGLAYGFHLGWSGNHRLAAETLPDGRGHVSMETLYLPGEVRLAPGDSLRTPDLYAAVSDAGLTGLSQVFHRHLRARPEHARLRAKPRAIHYNTWEAVYFEHDPAELMHLAEQAAAVGAERFVLDDGWFLGRRHDRAGLGDWRVDPAVYPEGLAPLIDRVEALGMAFGLWVEPEMVSPDSDLFRAHPDWALGRPESPGVFRNQLVLDFGRPAVRDHLFAQIDALLRAHRIAYLKWDMNSDLTQPFGADRRAAANAHVLGLYAVLDRLRAVHPSVEIESCASGGGRADYGILARTDRIWTSDSNDALDRLEMQRGFSHFFPLEVMGSHIGPAPCHITGRRISMAMRVATALFGHMGMELDLRSLDAEERAVLTAGIALHKAHRALIHSGELVRLDAPEEMVAFGIVGDGEALFSVSCVREARKVFPARLRFAGLDAGAVYRMRAVWPDAGAAVVAGGDALMVAGWQPPRMNPETTIVLHLVREG